VKLEKTSIALVMTFLFKQKRTATLSAQKEDFTDHYHHGNTTKSKTIHENKVL